MFKCLKRLLDFNDADYCPTKADKDLRDQLRDSQKRKDLDAFISAVCDHSIEIDKMQRLYGESSELPHSWETYKVEPVLDAGNLWYKLTKTLRTNYGSSCCLIDYYIDRAAPDKLALDGNAVGVAQEESNEKALRVWQKNIWQVKAAYLQTLSDEECLSIGNMITEVYENHWMLNRVSTTRQVRNLAMDIKHEAEERGLLND